MNQVYNGIGVAGDLILGVDLATTKVATFVTVVVLSAFGRFGRRR